MGGRVTKLDTAFALGLSVALHLGAVAAAMTLVPRLPAPESERGGLETVFDAVLVGVEDSAASEEGAEPASAPLDLPEPPPLQTASLLTEAPPIPVTSPDQTDLLPPVAPAVPAPVTVPEPSPTALPRPPGSVATPTAPRARPLKAKEPAPKREARRPEKQRANASSRNPAARGSSGAGEQVASHPAITRGGSGGAARTAGATDASGYRSRLVAHLTRYKTYPEQAQERGLTGRNAVTITLSRDGRVTASTLSTPSGQSLLDAATLAALRRAQPFPPMPEGGPATMTVTIGLRYDLR